MSIKLYEITNELREVLETIQDNPEQEVDYKDTLEAIQLEFEEKADHVACYIKELYAEAAAMKAEEKKLADRRKVREKQAAHLEKYLHNEMNTIGKKKIETSRNVISIRKTPASVQLEADFVLWALDNNDDLLTYSDPTPNKTMIKELLKAGVELPGASLVSGESFSIK